MNREKIRKRILITGGAKGLGKAIAIKFAEHKYDIILTYLNSEKEAQTLKQYLECQFGINVQICKVDLKSDEEIVSLTSKIDKLDCLVNNAAMNDDADIFSKSSETFMNILRVNLVAPFMLSKLLYPKLKEACGNIINIASTNGIDTMYEESLDYDASKAGLINMTKNLASAFSKDVRINAVAPGWIETESLENMNPQLRDSEEKKILLSRFANPEEIASLVYYIATEGTYMNGSIVRIDGGTKK